MSELDPQDPRYLMMGDLLNELTRLWKEGNQTGAKVTCMDVIVSYSDGEVYVHQVGRLDQAMTLYGIELMKRGMYGAQDNHRYNALKELGTETLASLNRHELECGTRFNTDLAEFRKRVERVEEKPKLTLVKGDGDGK